MRKRWNVRHRSGVELLLKFKVRAVQSENLLLEFGFILTFLTEH